ncbi:MAG: hypothetical protein FWF15_06045 [Oscillospiraceae bacterium]|nr:hypothetical protein [Oscillospiraceae bacterium]
MKQISIILLITILLGILISCGENEVNPQSSNDPNNDAAESGEISFENQIEYMNLSGYEIRFVVRGGTTGDLAVFDCIDLYADELIGDLINDAVYERNIFLEEKYNFKINVTTIAVPDYPGNVIRRSVMSSEDLYDVAYDGFNWTLSMVQENMLTDLYTLPHINFSKPYWRENINKDLSLGNKLYLTFGEHMLSINAGLYGVFFNKAIAEDLDVENLYNTVRDNKWTIEKYYNLSKGVVTDLNGDGIFDFYDLWGTTTQTHNAYTFLIASGEKIADKDENDFLELSLNNPRAVSVLELSAEFLMDKTATMIVDPDAERLWRIFPEGRALFSEGALMQTPGMRNMEVDFGILPNPKFEETQERYYHTPSVWNACLMLVPVTITQPEIIGYILELLAAKSTDTLTPAYYDLQLTHKLTRDEESGKMLDIMFSTVTFDMGAAFNFGGLLSMVINVGARGTNFASSYQSAENRAQVEIDKLTDVLKGE